MKQTNNNIIHRSTKKLYIKIKTKLHYYNINDKITLIKNEFNNWIDPNKNTLFFISHLRNKNYIEILKQE